MSTHSDDIEKTSSSPEKFSVLDVTLSRAIKDAAHQHGHYEKRDGRYILDPQEAKEEFGEEVASRLKLSDDGRFVLWPQPIGPDDPQAWTEGKKRLTLLVASLAAIVPDFSSGVGVAALFNLAKEFDTTTLEINNLTSNWSIFLLGWGGLAAVMFARRFGRLPVMFWSQVLGAAFMCGCTFSPNLKTFAAMRCLQSFFSTAPQVTGLYVATDIFPVHRQSRAIAIWTLAYIASPFLSPWLFGYLTARQSWRWAYGAGALYGLFVVIVIVLFLDETMYDRHTHPPPALPKKSLAYRLKTLVGITGWQKRKTGVPMWRSALDMINLLWRPHFILPLIVTMWAFGFTIGINVTNPVFLAEPKPIGFGLKSDIVSTIYITPIVGAFIGEAAARLFSRASTLYSMRRNKGVLEAEDLLLPTIPGVCLYVLGMCLFGWANLEKSSLVGVIFGWGFVEVGTVCFVVANLAYASLAFPDQAGDCSALVNMARVLGGFAVPYFETTWAEKSGTLVVFGTEAGIVAALWIISFPIVYLFGRTFREKFSIARSDRI